VRPLHAADDEPLNDWLNIRSQAGLRHHPIIDNQMSEGLRLAADRDQQPGQQVEVLQQVPAGYHELEVSPGQHDLLIEVAAQAPRFPLAVLPPLNPSTARLALSGERKLPEPDEDSAGPAIFMTQASEGCRATGRCQLQPLGSPRDATPLSLPTAADFQALQAHRPPAAITMAESSAEKSLEARLIELLWQAEQGSEQQLALLSQAEQLAQSQLQAPGVEAILRRLRRSTSWRLLRIAQESGGVRLVEFTGWHPEDPGLRVRKAVMGLDANNEQVISGRATQVFTLHNTSPVEISLSFAKLEAAYQPSQPMRVLLSWDDQAPTEVVLHGVQSEWTVRQALAAGEHVLRIRIAEPLLNQYLRIKFKEHRANNSHWISEPAARRYLLATHEQPLVLMVQGPTRLRIDEWRDGQTLVSYRNLEAGWQRVVIPLQAGRDEALLRVFRRTLEPARPMLTWRRSRYQPEPLEAPAWPQTPSLQLPAASLATPSLGGWIGQGTGTLTSGWTSRRLLDEEPGATAAEERFFNLGAAYRWSSGRQDTYYQADANLRLHEVGEPTLAMRGFVSMRKADWPIDLDIAGRLYLQHLETSARLEHATAFHLRLSRRFQLGEKVTQRPSLGVFHRWLSLDGLPQDAAEQVDQDIYTDYKQDHKQGLRIGDRILYRPWLDSSWYAGAYLVSNEDLNLIQPDHLKLILGGKQLFGDLALGLSYSHFAYFADDDREQASDAQRLRLDADFSRWINPFRGLEARLSYLYDQESGDSSIYLSLSLNYSNGRYYQDFRPGDLDFRSIRQRKVLERQILEGWQ
jgi:hypothetical protein